MQRNFANLWLGKLLKESCVLTETYAKLHMIMVASMTINDG